MGTLARDLQYAVRLQLRDGRYAAMVILTLAICIAANTAIFTVVNSVLLKPLPVAGADDILMMSNHYPKAGVPDSDNSAPGDYFDRMRDVTALADQAVFQFRSETIETGGVPQQMTGIVATPSLFRLLRVAMPLGQPFRESDGQPGNERKLILSHALWRQLYGGDRGAVGRELRLSGRPYTVTGVMPEGFLFIDPEVRFWVPVAFSAEDRNRRHSNNWFNVGRLKPGATLRQVQAQVNALNRANLERFPEWREALLNAGFYTKVQPLKDLVIRDVKSTLLLLWAGAGLVLLIGAVNIASMVLARLNVRMKELGTRLAIGARPSHLIRQLMVENVAMAIAGGGLGLGLGALVIRAMATLGLERLPRGTEVHVDGAVIAVALGLSILCGAIIALVPVSYVVRFSLSSVLHESSRGGSSGRRSRFVRQALVVAQVGLAFVLLTGAGLLVASFRELMKVNPGFQTEGVLTAATVAPGAAYPEGKDLTALMRRSLAAIRAMPGVIAAGATTGIPFRSNYSDSVIVPEGFVPKPGESVLSPTYITVTPGYFEAMGIRLVRGRYFDERDTHTSLPVVIVDERMAKRFWPASDAVGKRLFLPSNPEMKVDGNTRWLTVVGVVRTVRLKDLAGSGVPNGIYYFPYSQNPQRAFTYAVRTQGDGMDTAQALRRVMADLDPTLAVFDVKTMRERAALSMSSRKTAMSLALSFGGVALFLSAVGIYAVLSYLMAQRRREIGIRMAAGGSQGAIFRLFLREGAVLVAGGLALGLAGSLAFQKAIEKEIYGVRPLDPLVLAAVTALLGLAALMATVWPARRAAAIDPVRVLTEQ